MTWMVSLLLILPMEHVLANWTRKQALNCYADHGATEIDKISLGSMTLSACQEKCADTPDCTGVVVDTEEADCWRRKDINISECDDHFGNRYDTWLKEDTYGKQEFSATPRLKVIHAEPPLPSDWHQHSSPLANITFRISLKQLGKEELTRIAKQVSDPSSEMYGKYLTQKELDQLMLPPTHGVDAVAQWASKMSCSALALREVVTISCDAAAAEALLETTCKKVQNRVTEQFAVRCSDFSLPQNVHEATQAVYGLHGLPMPPSNNEQGRRLQPVPPLEVVQVTPAVLESTYKISGVTPSGSEKNRQAVAEFQRQTMSQADLDTFWKQYLPHVKPELGKVHKFVGDNNTGYPETEANLDIQYIMGVAPGILTEFWYFEPSDFCGDLKRWTQKILETENPPQVHSVSYGWQGNMTTLMGCNMENVNDVDLDFTKLAARGITIVFASGDSGSGYTRPSTHAQCDPPSSVEQGVEIVGTVIRSESVPAMQECCYVASEIDGVAWTYETSNQEMCSEQLVVKGVSWDGEGFVKSGVNSSDACCSTAHQMDRASWSYDAQHQQCVFFTEVKGRISDPGSVSGMGEPVQDGTCTIFSKITSKKKNSRANSAVPAQAHVELYPSWPASSPWVTAVGSTRFVNQIVGQPEMATDQFGSGGGFSEMFDAFQEQKADIAHYLQAAPQLPPNGTFSRPGRATPDVAGLGEGYQVIIRGHPESIGGTSASTPMFAGLVSLLNEARLARNMPVLGFLNPWLYKHADAFTDVILGDNAKGRSSEPEPYGFNCIKGWDPVTGLGTPRFDKMLTAATGGSSADIVV